MQVWGNPRQIRGGIPAEAVARGEAPRQHVILEHVVQADPYVARQEDGDQPQSKRHQEYTQGEGISEALQSCVLDAPLS